MASGEHPDAHLAIIYAGGTFGMTDAEDGLTPTAGIRDRVRPILTGRTPGGASYTWEYVELPEVLDSAEADESTAPALAARIRGALAAGACGAVVIHGTDTLAYTAARVAFETAGLRSPIVFTGAQRPLGSRDSDAPANLGAAAAAIAEGRAGRGTRIAFGGDLLAAVRASKVSADDQRAFAAPRAVGAGARPFAWLRRPLIRSSRIGSYRFIPGSDARSLGCALAATPDGLVLECYGAGTGPLRRPGMQDALRRAIRGGTPVVAVTQCETGSVQFGRYAISAGLAEVGVLDGGDMTFEAALAKLAALTGRGLGGAELAEAMSANLIGERTLAGLA